MQSAVSPPRPLLPPQKKQRAGSTPQADDDNVTSAIARRRAKILELQRQKERESAVIEKARDQLQSSGPTGPPPTSRYGSGVLRGGGRPSVPPPGSAIARVRNSDIFPTVSKTETESLTKKGPPVQAPPPITTTQPSSVARRLDASFSSGTTAAAAAASTPKPPVTRSKSAPPSRPRPPPPRPDGPPPAETAPKGVSFGTIPTKHVVEVSSQPPKTPGQRGTSGLTNQTPLEQQHGTWNTKNAGRTPAPTLMGETTSATPAGGVTVEQSARKSYAGHTLSPTEGTWNTKDAGRTPFPTFVGGTTTATPAGGVTVQQSARKAYAGHTPFPSRSLPVEDDTPQEKETPETLRLATDMSNNAFLSPEPSVLSPTVGASALTLTAVSPSDSVPTQPVGQEEKDQQDTVQRAISPELRMQKELARLENEKAKALNQVAGLQKEVQQLQDQVSSPNATAPNATAVFQAILNVADTQGDQAALQWTRQQASSGGAPKNMKQVGFLTSPVGGMWKSSSQTAAAAAGSPLASLSPIRKRAPTPYPKRGNALTTLSAEEELETFLEAVDTTPHEYDSPIASFIIRKPYGRATERDLWFSAGQLNAKLYGKEADPSKASTLEVVAKIEADGSLFALYGDAMVRHQKADGSWKDYGNADENPLGFVSYIDTDASEKEYSLDEIFQGAVAVREHYCSSICCVASAIRASSKPKEAAPGASVSSPPPAATMDVPVTPRVATKDAGVGTQDLPFPANKTEAQGTKPDEKAEQPKKKEKKSPPPEEPSSGILASFIGMFFNAFFGVLWYLFVRLPMRIISTAIVMMCAAVILATIWLYLKDDHGAARMGALMHPEMYNRPGIA